MSKRFDYVAYDETAVEQSKQAKHQCLVMEAFIEGISAGRAQALALTKLEETYAWIGKAIRDEQVNKRGAALQEGRSNE